MGHDHASAGTEHGGSGPSASLLLGQPAAARHGVINPGKKASITYKWPVGRVYIWVLLQSICTTGILGISASLVRFKLAIDESIPWNISYWLACSSITLLLILGVIYMISYRKLRPIPVSIGCMLLTCLWFVGIIATFRLYFQGHPFSVKSQCHAYTKTKPKASEWKDILAWLEWNHICEAWVATICFQIIGMFLLWWMGAMGIATYKSAKRVRA